MATAQVGCAAESSTSPPSLHTSLHLLMQPMDRDAPFASPSCPPNPPFIFPARSTSPSMVPSSARTRRRPMSMADIQSRSAGPVASTDAAAVHYPAALPEFSFNPGASLPADPEPESALSPPITPNSARPIPSPSRPAGHGHRRGGSEFVGGSIRHGNSIAVMSISPTKSESGFASPGSQPPRRGHRRGISGAISTNDLPLLRPQIDLPMHRGGSAPNSPTTFRPGECIPLSFSEKPPALSSPASCSSPRVSPDAAENIVGHSIFTTASVPKAETSPKQSRLGRARVGFSDTLEFIPRPLSLVSSDTSSTITARPGHSVSGSISSIVSVLSPNDREIPASHSRSTSLAAIADLRPSTAGAVLEGTTDANVSGITTSPRRRNSTPTMLGLLKNDNVRPPSPNSARTPKRWSFFGLESLTGPAPAPDPSSLSSSSSDSIAKATSVAASSSEYESDSSDADGVQDDVRTPRQSRRRASRKKRVKGWAGSILPLRGSKRRSRTHNLRSTTPSASPEIAEQDRQDNGTTATETNATTHLHVVKDSESKRPGLNGTSTHRAHEEGSYPMIDLDAALGPFNTPLPHNPEWEAAQRAAGNTASKRRLHSAQGMKGFVGPGMHYHRRAESAPDLPPFDPGRVGINRFGSNSTMADVFEEEEEEDGDAKRHHSRPGKIRAPEATWSSGSDGEATPPATQSVTEVASDRVANEAAAVPDVGRAGHGTGNGTTHVVRPERSRTSLHDDVISEDSASIVFRNAFGFSDALNDQQDSASSSPRVATSGHREPPTAEAYPGFSLTNTPNMPLSPYSTSHASSYASPRSPMSLDAQRISTAASSINDENSLHSLLMGEPGPEVRLSVDYDIPSLTSSNSTMTRESTFVPNARMSQPNLREQRPASVSSAALGRRRSSLVSLSRLISSSHGERSKLSMEVTLDNDIEDKRGRPKSSKTKRLSRMMQFWKPNKDDGT